MERTSIIRRGHEFVTQFNPDLLERVLKAKARGYDETFYTTSRRGHPIAVKILPDTDLYVRMMAAKGFSVRIGAI